MGPPPRIRPEGLGRSLANGRQSLEKLVAFRGFVRNAQGAEVALPEGDLAILQRKHAKAIAKMAKAQEAAEATAGKDAA